jgi:hypothetical protein
MKDTRPEAVLRNTVSPARTRYFRSCISEPNPGLVPVLRRLVELAKQSMLINLA